MIPQRNISLLSNRLAEDGSRRIPEAVLERDRVSHITNRTPSFNTTSRNTCGKPRGGDRGSIGYCSQLLQEPSSARSQLSCQN